MLCTLFLYALPPLPLCDAILDAIEEIVVRPLIMYVYACSRASFVAPPRIHSSVAILGIKSTQNQIRAYRDRAKIGQRCQV